MMRFHALVFGGAMNAGFAYYTASVGIASYPWFILGAVSFFVAALFAALDGR